MRQTKHLLTTGLILLALNSLSFADTIPWAPNLSAAMNMASKQNRLVLIHFWSPDCAPCRSLERNVFSDPQVGNSLAVDYIPVKVNVQQLPETARRYKVESWPTDVVVTPAGYMLNKSGCSQNPQKYTSSLKMVALRHRQSNQNMIAGNAPPQNFASTAQSTNAIRQPFGTTQNSFSPQANASPSSLTQPRSRYSSASTVPSHNSIQPSNDPYYGNQPARSAPIAPGYANQPVPAQTPYQGGQPQTNQYTTNRFQQPQGSNTRGSRWSQPANSPLPGRGSPRVAQAPVSPPGFQRGLQQNSHANVPSAGQRPLNKSWSQNTPPPTAPLQNRAVQQPQQPLASQGAASASAPGIFMDGYCPVSLVEKSTWTKGDVRWGANHRGRTYLFTSAAEQARFLASPDRYAPVLSGNDPVRYSERGELVAGSRKHGVFYHNQVYLFADEASLERFWGSPERFANIVRQAMQPRSSAPR